MNKGIVCLVCAAALGCSAAASAQVTGGVKGGLNLANMTFTVEGESRTPGYRTGAAAGAFLEVPVSRTIAVQPEVLLTMKGSSGTFGVTNFSETIKMTYLDVPVLLRIKIPTTASVAPFVYAGPSFGFPLTARVTQTNSGVTQPEEDIKGDLKSADVGIAFGGGIQFGALSVEARFTQGLTNIVKDQVIDGAGTVKNRTIAVMAGLKFK